MDNAFEVGLHEVKPAPGIHDAPRPTEPLADGLGGRWQEIRRFPV